MFTNSKHLAAMAAFLALAIQSMSQSAWAVPRTWSRTSGGAYFSPNNWTPNGVPVAGDDVRFSLSSSTQQDITLIQDRVAADLLISGGDLRFAGVGIDAYSVDTATIQDPAKLTIEGVTREYDFNVAGQLTLKGELSLLNGSRLASGATLVDGVNGSNASLRLTKTDPLADAPSWQTTNISIGFNSSGDVRIEAGSTVQGSQAFVGTGSLVVSGADVSGNPSTLTTTGPLQVGTRPDSLLRVTDGGLVSILALGVGVNESAGVEIDGRGPLGVGSRLEINSLLSITDSEVTVSNGGQLTSGDTQLTLGSISVSDNGSIWMTDGLFVLDGGLGLSVSNGARAASKTVEIGAIRHGFINVDSGIWTNSGDAYVGGGRFQGNSAGGTLEVSDGLAIIGEELTLWENGLVDLRPSGSLIADRIDHTHGGEFRFSGELQANRFEGDLINEGGVLTPGGAAAGATNIFGDYTQESDATLPIQIGGLTPLAQHDVVTVTGDTSLDGLLNLSLIDGFVPAADDAFTIFSSGGLFGFFDNVLTGQRLETTDGAGSFIVNYGVGSELNPSQIILTDFMLTASLPGDYNGDGVVNAADYTVWRENLGAPAGSLPNDTDGGVIGAAQYQTWAGNYGSASASPMSPALSTTVPEPTAACLLVIGCAVFARRLRQGS